LFARRARSGNNPPMANTVLLTDVGALRDKLRRDTHGQQLEIARLNQVARQNFHLAKFFCTRERG